MLPMEGYRIGDPVGLWVRTGGYGRREGGWVGREPGRREDRATMGLEISGHRTTIFQVLLGAGHIYSEFTPIAQHCTPGEQR